MWAVRWKISQSPRRRCGKASKPVFTAAYRTTARALEIVVEAAQATFAAAGKDTSRLDGFTWHENRHTFASRLVMAGVDLRTVQELGGRRTLGMVQGYAHLAPDRLAAAVERIVMRVIRVKSQRRWIIEAPTHSILSGFQGW
jgi:site-specific recombinase XerD